MQLVHKQARRPQAVIDKIGKIDQIEKINKVIDPDRRQEIAERATETASQIAAGVAERSTELGSKVGDRVSDVVQTLAQEGHELMKQSKDAGKNAKVKTVKVKKPRKHRLRRAMMLTGLGAAAAYFLDPKAGAERRAAAMRRTSTSAQAVGDGLDKAARVAHQTADATTVGDPLKAAAETMDFTDAP